MILLARVDRAVGLIQEDTTGIINDLTEIQTQEKNLQAAFETDLSQTIWHFSILMIAVEKNIQKRKSRLESTIRNGPIPRDVEGIQLKGPIISTSQLTNSRTLIVPSTN